MPHDIIAPGTVWLVGAGPGDPELLTRKAERLIAAADIVFHDALVGPGVLDLIPAGIARISVVIIATLSLAVGQAVTPTPAN